MKTFLKRPNKLFSRPALFLVILFVVSVFALTTPSTPAYAIASAEDINLAGFEPPSDGFSSIDARLEIPIPYVNLTSAVSSGDGIAVPFLAQYISGIYQFLISIVGVLAGVFILIGGFQYLTAGGSPERVTSAKRRIANALTGLILALSSYVILFAINPDLLKFDSLQLTTIRVDPFDFGDEGDESGVIVADKFDEFIGNTDLVRPKALCSNKTSCATLCESFKADPSSIPEKVDGMATIKTTELIKNTTGVNVYGKKRTTKTTNELLVKAGELAAKDGYTILVTSAFRDLAGQVKLACNDFDDPQSQGSKVGHTIAKPGGSFHGIGFALDVQLWEGTPKGKCSKQANCVSTSGSSKQQQDIKWKDGAEKLMNIMLEAGFRRLNNEIWHFEPASAPAASCRCTTSSECSLPPKVSC